MQFPDEGVDGCFRSSGKRLIELHCLAASKAGAIPAGIIGKDVVDGLLQRLKVPALHGIFPNLFGQNILEHALEILLREIGTSRGDHLLPTTDAVEEGAGVLAPGETVQVADVGQLYLLTAAFVSDVQSAPQFEPIVLFSSC